MSDKARETWKPIFGRITKAWWDIEWMSVVHGLRSCSLTFVTPESLVDKGGEWVKSGLTNLPLAIMRFASYYNSVRLSPVESGDPFVYRIAVGRPQHISEFKAAWDAGDNGAIGKLLGYPACCMDFFLENWVKHALEDSTWPMAAGGVASEERSLIEVSGPPEANILWRWLGIRAVPHLPCSFCCNETVEFGKKMIDVGRQEGYAQEMDWLLEILSWPVEWSALHGIAEIKTPVLKISTLTDATPVKYVVRRDGGSYPSEGASGLHFPYTLKKDGLTGKPSGTCEQRALPSWYVTDNGFSSVQAMKQAHGPIIELAASSLDDRDGDILDLGCGNGALLREILLRKPCVVPYGVDLSSESIDHARRLLPDFGENFRTSDIFDSPGTLWGDKVFSLAILMPGRLLEKDRENAEKLRTFLDRNCRMLLLYAYGDWLKRYGSLSGLAEAAGFSLREPKASGRAGLALVKKS